MLNRKPWIADYTVEEMKEMETEVSNSAKASDFRRFLINDRGHNEQQATECAYFEYVVRVKRQMAMRGLKNNQIF